MSDELSPELRRELLDDFYSECDELLVAVRAGLDQLEASGAGSKSTAKIVEALFRNTHSLKGISAIVGLRPAELIAHAMEELLRGLSKSQLTVTPALIEALMAGTQRIESIVTAHRKEKPLPESSAVLTQLASVGQVVPGTVGPDAVPTANAETKGPVKKYRVTFLPSKELEKKGVNVTSVRERLQAVGEIYSAVPTVKAGVIEFGFLVGLRSLPADWSQWETDSLRIEPEEESPPTMPAPELPASDDIHEALSLSPSHMVRVDLARLDDLMRIAGEMVIHRSRLEDRIQQSVLVRESLKEVSVALGRSFRDLREAITRVRMVPIAEIFARIPFVVRDLRRDSDKKVRVVTEGNQTEIDKYLVERLKEPLLHLVRNAFAHGIEPESLRQTVHKPREATITLRAKSAGEFVIIQIKDDGRGIDAQSVVTRARALGMIVPNEPSPAGLLEILCSAGFSTKEEADMAAGRGVGMAVVANTVRDLGGSLSLESWPGNGTEFTLKLPLTLSIADAIIVTVNGEVCAIPQSSVTELIQISATEVRSIRDTEVIPYRGGLLPIIRLRTLFRVPPLDVSQLTLLVIGSDRGEIGLLVDSVRAQREIVIRPLSDPLLRVPGITGATELGDGRPILILDPAALAQRVVRPTNNADYREEGRLVTPPP